MLTFANRGLRHQGNDTRPITVLAEFSSVASDKMEHGQRGRFTVRANSPHATMMGAVRQEVQAEKGITVHNVRFLRLYRDI